MIYNNSVNEIWTWNKTRNNILEPLKTYIFEPKFKIYKD